MFSYTVVKQRNYLLLLDENGGLEVRFMKLVGAGKVQRIEIRSADIEFQSFNANVFSGKILINPSSNTLAENLAVFWSICVLYVLCRPRNRDYSIEFTPTGNTMYTASITCFRVFTSLLRFVQIILKVVFQHLETHKFIILQTVSLLEPFNSLRFIDTVS